MCFITQTGMLFRVKECAIDIYSWTAVEIRNCPRQTEIDRWSLYLWLIFFIWNLVYFKVEQFSKAPPASVELMS